MKNTVCNKRTVLALSLAMLVSGVSSNAYAKVDCCSAPAVTAATTFAVLFGYDVLYKGDKGAFTAKKFGRNVAAAAALALFVRYYTKESVAEEKYTEKSDVKKLADVKNIMTKEYWENFLDVVDEKIVGQRPKNNKIKVEAKGDELVLGEISARKPGKGLMGKSEELAKPFKDGAKSALGILAVIFAGNKLEALRNYIASKLGLAKLRTQIDSDNPTASAPVIPGVVRFMRVDRNGNPIN